MITRIAAILGTICLPAVSLASGGYVSEGDWKGMFSKDGCMIWTVATSEPNAQIHFRHNDERGISLDLSAASWHDSGTTFKSDGSGFAEAFMFNVPPEDGVRFDVIPAGHMASLVEMHRPDQLQQVIAFLSQSATDEQDIGIADQANAPHGRFSTSGFLPMMEGFSACLTDKAG